MANENLKSKASPFGLALIVGGFIWIVSESLLFGALAGFATIVLLKRDAKEDEQDHER